MYAQKGRTLRKKINNSKGKGHGNVRNNFCCMYVGWSNMKNICISDLY